MKNAQSGVALALREVPTFWTRVVGDFDGNFSRGPEDLDILLRELHQRSQGLSRGYNWSLDLDSSGTITSADFDILLAIMSVCRGDINLSGTTTEADFDILSSHMNNQVPENVSGWSYGDLNGDGVVNLADIIILRDNLGCGT